MAGTYTLPYSKIMIDSPDVMEDGAGTPWCAVQVVDPTTKAKFAAVLAMEADQQWHKRYEFRQIYGAPKLEIFGRRGLVVGAGQDGKLYLIDLPLFVPVRQ